MNKHHTHIHTNIYNKKIIYIKCLAASLVMDFALDPVLTKRRKPFLIIFIVSGAKSVHFTENNEFRSYDTSRFL